MVCSQNLTSYVLQFRAVCVWLNQLGCQSWSVLYTWFTLTHMIYTYTHDVHSCIVSISTQHKALDHLMCTFYSQTILCVVAWFNQTWLQLYVLVCQAYSLHHTHYLPSHTNYWGNTLLLSLWILQQFDMILIVANPYARSSIPWNFGMVCTGLLFMTCRIDGENGWLSCAERNKFWLCKGRIRLFRTS